MYYVYSISTLQFKQLKFNYCSDSEVSNKTQEPQYAHVTYMWHLACHNHVRTSEAKASISKHKWILVLDKWATLTESCTMMHGPQLAAVASAGDTAAAAGCDVAGLAATGTVGLDMHYFEHLQEIQSLTFFVGPGIMWHEWIWRGTLARIFIPIPWSGSEENATTHSRRHLEK